MSAKNELDQYYTSPKYAKECYDRVPKALKAAGYPIENLPLLEPCVGAGAFYNLMKKNNRIGFDLEPKVEGVPQRDFLTTTFEEIGRCYVVSNPPFGRNAQLAVDFFNHCAYVGAEVIAFIIPRTFRKASIENKLDRHFFKIFDETSPKNSFLLEGQEYDVPCCFQVWVKDAEKTRALTDTSASNDFMDFVSKEEADFAIRRVGGRAGQLLEGLDYKEVSTYFVKAKIDKEELRELLEQLDLTYERDNTAGVRSVAKFEIVNNIKEMLK